MPSLGPVRYLPDNAEPATPIDQMTEDACKLELLRLKRIVGGVTTTIKDNVELGTDRESFPELGRELFHFKNRQMKVEARLLGLNPNTDPALLSGKIFMKEPRCIYHFDQQLLITAPLGHLHCHNEPNSPINSSKYHDCTI